MSRPMTNPGRLFWTGQHWINYLRLPGSDEDAGRFSLWHTHYCEAGEGTVVYVDIPPGEADGLRCVCTNNRELATFMDRWIRSLSGPYDIDTVVDAEILRTGDIRVAPAWTVRTATDTVVSTWSGVQQPVILEAPAPMFREDRDVYSYLFFTDGGELALNGHAIEGQPYVRDNWKSSIGGDRSSCVIALSETFVQVPEADRSAS